MAIFFSAAADRRLTPSGSLALGVDVRLHRRDELLARRLSGAVRDHDVHRVHALHARENPDVPDARALERPLLIVVHVAARRGRAHLEQKPRVILRVRLLGVAAAHLGLVIAPRNALHRHRHLRHRMRGQISGRTVRAAGHRHFARAVDGDGFRRRELHAARALEQRALLYRARALNRQHAAREGRGLARDAAARVDVPVKLAARQVFRVERRPRVLDHRVRLRQPQACRRQQVVGRKADGFLVAVRHAGEQRG